MVFLHAGGTIVERTLGPGEQLHVDTGCVVAIEPSVDFDIQQAGGIKSMLFGGEGLFFASLRGPGKIWLQSLPFSRLAGRMLAAAPQRGGSKGEGSILGGSRQLVWMETTKKYRSNTSLLQKRPRIEGVFFCTIESLQIIS